MIFEKFFGETSLDITLKEGEEKEVVFINMGYSYASISLPLFHSRIFGEKLYNEIYKNPWRSFYEISGRKKSSCLYGNYETLGKMEYERENIIFIIHKTLLSPSWIYYTYLSSANARENSYVTRGDNFYEELYIYAHQYLPKFINSLHLTKRDVEILKHGDLSGRWNIILKNL